MVDLTCLRSPREVCEAVARSSRGTASAEQIVQGWRRPAGHHHYYGFCLAVFIWATQTDPMLPISLACEDWHLPEGVLGPAMRVINKDAELEPLKIMNDIAAALWPEHPYYRGGPTHG